MSRFVIRAVPSGVKFDLRHTNSQIIASGEVYETRDACLRGIASIRKNAPTARVEDRTADGWHSVSNPKFELYQDRSGQFRFRLKARNGQIIAVSEGYSTKTACENGIASVRANAPRAEIEEA